MQGMALPVRWRIGRQATALLAALCALMPAAQAKEPPQTFSGDYVVSFLGLTVARSRVSAVLEDGRFSMEGTLASAGFARFFDDTDGTVASSGGFSDNSTRPASFRLAYRQGEKPTTTVMSFAKGRVVKAETLPLPKPRGADWVTVAPGDLDGVVDPLSATLVKASGPQDVCRRRVAVFDGEMRLDLALSPVAEGSGRVDGEPVATVTCKAKVKPVSGFRKGRRALEFLEKRSRIMVVLAPLGTTGVYAPVHATVGTEIGTVSIRARGFRAD